MQELSVQPTNPTPYTPVGGTYNNNPVPGAGGLPALSGLSSNMNPMAQQLQAQGRGDDSMLIHMTPGEVNSLRGLAQQFGGDLTVNPNTGLPEAGWLGKLLPTILGIAGAAFGIPTWAIGLGVGAGQTALTGDIGKGLAAGLQAFGGAGLGQAAGVGGKLGNIGADLGLTKSATGASSALTAANEIPKQLAGDIAQKAGAAGIVIPEQTAAAIAQKATPGFLGKFGAETALGQKGLIGKTLPMVAGSSVLGAVSDATAPQLPKYEGEENKWKYEGPYMPQQRRLNPTVQGEGEISFFENANPYPGFLTRTGGMPTGYAEGGSTEQASSRPSWLTADMVDPQAISAARAQYLNSFDERLKGITDLTDVNKNYVQQLRAGIADSSDITIPQLRAIAESRLAQLEGALKEDRMPAAPATPSGGGVTTDGKFIGGNIDPDKGGVTPGSGTGATLSGPKLSPGATQSGFGAEMLRDKYTPQFTQKADFVTAPATPYTGGTEALARLQSLTDAFRTSPGAVTASRTYAGGSPSQRIREAAKARATGEIDYGLRNPASGTGTGTNTAATTNNPYLDPNFTGNFFNEYWSGYSNPGAVTAGTGNVTTVTPADRYINPYAGMYNNPYASADFTGGSTGGAPRDLLNSDVQLVAKGGEVHMDDGAFVVDARTVSELGNGSSNAGIELLQRLGGRPVRGPGDGVSDSVRANIGGKQEARVARDEVIIPAAAVRKLGGAKKLYALMDKAHKARKKAKRGEDTKVAKGLGALA